MELHLRFEKARDLFRAYPQIEEDLTARPKGHTSLEFLVHLEHSASPEEALVYTSYLLPKRQAIWWGHECLSNENINLPEIDRHISDLVVAWVGAPNESNRKKVYLTAKRVRPTSGAAWLGHAVGSCMTTTNSEEAPPASDGFMAHRFVSFATSRALRSIVAGARESALRSFIAAGLRTQYREAPKPALSLKNLAEPTIRQDHGRKRETTLVPPVRRREPTLVPSSKNQDFVRVW